MKCKTKKEAELRYGPINFVTKKWPDEAKWMAVCVIPEDIAVVWPNTATGLPTRKIYCNKDMAGPLLKALAAVKAAGLLHELVSFDGCFQIRTVRGSTTSMSAHSMGLAIDLSAKDNGLGVVGNLTPAFVKCFKDQGFDHGGDFSRKDGMHLSFCWEGTNTPTTI